MCGIVGLACGDFAKSQDNCKILLESLAKLEYRGYDSIGFSYLMENGDIFTKKSPTKISEFLSQIDFASHKFSTAIAHTRWATHGGVSEINSHPHTGKFASVVHNGIIENYLELKKQLTDKGYHFSSQTDTEVITHLISHIIERDIGVDKFSPTYLSSLNNDQKIQLISNIVKKLTLQIRGAFAIAAIVKNLEGFVICIKNRSPMVVAKGLSETNTNFVASDGYAISNYCNQFYTMQDGQYAVLHSSFIKIFDKNNIQQQVKFETINYTQENDSKGSFSSFMEKEIYDQPQTIRQNLDFHIANDNSIKFTGIDFSLSKFDKICLIACGTSYYAANLFCYYAESLAKISATCEIASEFRYRDIVFLPKTLYVFISQSGETADTIAALDFVNQNKHKSSKTIAVINVKQSTIAKKCNGFIECLSGREIGVASTKNFTNQCISLALLAIKIAKDKKIKHFEDKLSNIISSIKNLPSAFYAFLSSSENIEILKQFALQIASHKKVMFVARSILYPIALEGALKLKELSYIPTEGIAAGELKHGPIALVDENLACICLLSKDIFKEKSESSVQEILSRNGKCLIISDYSPQNLQGSQILHINTSFGVDENFNKFILPMLFIPAIQMLSYLTASNLKFDVDKPRNLAKSVTVE